MALKWLKQYSDWKVGLSSADTGSGSRSSSSVCGGWRPGSSSPLKDSASSASAECQLSDTALQQRFKTDVTSVLNEVQ